MNNKVYPRTIRHENPAFEELWFDRCASVESDVFEDIDLDVSGVASALSKDDSNDTSQEEAKWPRRKRLSVYACLMLAC